MTTPTPEALARQIVLDWEGQLTVPVSQAAQLDLERRIALALTKRDTLRGALTELVALVEEGWLVRNTTNDAHMSSFLSESVRLVKALAATRAALVQGEEEDA